MTEYLRAMNDVPRFAAAAHRPARRRLWESERHSPVVRMAIANAIGDAFGFGIEMQDAHWIRRAITHFDRWPHNPGEPHGTQIPSLPFWAHARFWALARGRPRLLPRPGWSLKAGRASSFRHSAAAGVPPQQRSRLLLRRRGDDCGANEGPGAAGAPARSGRHAARVVSGVAMRLLWRHAARVVSAAVGFACDCYGIAV